MKRMSGHCLWMEKADIKHVTPPNTSRTTHGSECCKESARSNMESSSGWGFQRRYPKEEHLS